MTDRADRLKAALRENLKRRKAHARGRADEEGETPKPAAAPAKPGKDGSRKT